MIKATAHPNIALAKYWGKRNETLNLPAVGSVSITLDKLATFTEIKFLEDTNKDKIFFNGTAANENEQIKFANFINYFRNLSGNYNFVEINTENNFPTSAGLASSASGFAALSKAANELFELKMSDKHLSQIARLGSGSASRSIFGGFAEWHRGSREDGSDCFAEQISANDNFPLSVIIAVTSLKSKKISSRDGMKNSAITSPYYNSFVETSEQDIKLIKHAILTTDFDLLSEISMRSTVKMHSVMMTTNPPLFYWNHITFEIIELIRELISEKFKVFFTIDAGPQVKIITLKENEEIVLSRLREISQIEQIIVCKIGNGAEIIKEGN